MAKRGPRLWAAGRRGAMWGVGRVVGVQGGGAGTSLGHEPCAMALEMALSHGPSSRHQAIKLSGYWAIQL